MGWLEVPRELEEARIPIGGFPANGDGFGHRPFFRQVFLVEIEGGCAIDKVTEMIVDGHAIAAIGLGYFVADGPTTSDTVIILRQRFGRLESDVTLVAFPDRPFGFAKDCRCAWRLLVR